MLDEIERQLQSGDPRPTTARARRVVVPRPPDRSGSPGALAILAIAGGLATVVAGVLIGAVVGVLISVVGFGAVVASGVVLVRSFRESIVAQVHEIASRYQGPVR